MGGRERDEDDESGTDEKEELIKSEKRKEPQPLFNLLWSVSLSSSALKTNVRKK